MSEWNQKRSIMRRYDLTAHIYDMRYAEEQAAKIEKALENVSIGEGSVVLDAGCGTGILFNYIADKTKKIVGIDISRKTLIEAKRRAQKFQNVHLIVADVDNMPLRGEAFTLVFGITVLQNMPDPARALGEIVRITKENGVIVVSGMKKAFALNRLAGLLKNAGLKMALLDSEGLQCHIAVCIRVLQF